MDATREPGAQDAALKAFSGTVRYALVSNARTARLIALMLATTVAWYICAVLT